MSLEANDMSVVPGWFERGLADPGERQEVEVDGVPIGFLTWGNVGSPGLILIHGSNAHARWWQFVAPFLADKFRVAAIDLSGNGDSGWRERYSGEQYATEVMAVCDAAQLGEAPVVIGHSFGGYVALETGYRHDAALGGVMFFDFTVNAPEAYYEWGNKLATDGKSARPTRVYEDLAAATRRFRLLPEQPSRCPGLMDWLAGESLREVPGGWTWKFDPSMYDFLTMGPGQRDKFLAITSPTALVTGQLSTDEGALAGDYMLELTRGMLPVIELPGTHHHFMFEEPLAVVAVIKATVLGWLDVRAHG